MHEDDTQAVAALLSPLLRALEMLAFVARHLHPPDLEAVVASIGTPDDELRSALSNASAWPERLLPIKATLAEASETALLAFAGLRNGLQERGDVRRALRLLPKALKRLYPLAGILPAVNQFFLDPQAVADHVVDPPSNRVVDYGNDATVTVCIQG